MKQEHITILTKDIDLANSYFAGYKYYLPRGVKIVNKKEYNAKLISGKNSYYLFVDVIGDFAQVITIYHDIKTVYHGILYLFLYPSQRFGRRFPAALFIGL